MPYNIQTSNIVAMLEGTLIALGIDYYASYRSIGRILSGFVLLFIATSVLFDRKMPQWQMICLLAGSQVLCAGLVTQYLLLYMIIPAWYFLNSHPDKTKKHMMYGILLAAILLSIPGSAGIGNVFTFVKGTITLFVVIIILANSCVRMFDMYRARKKISETHSVKELDDY